MSGIKTSAFAAACVRQKSGRELKPLLEAIEADKYNLKIHANPLRLECYIIIFLLVF